MVFYHIYPALSIVKIRFFLKKSKPKSRPGIKLTFYSANFRTELLKELLQRNILFFKKVLTNNLSCGIMYKLC